LSRSKWLVVLAVCIAAAGIRSISLGKDASWDLKNYHWYNPYALLNNRLAFDVAPAQLQSYHYPLVELPFYGLVQATSDPRIVAFFMAVPAGIASFFLLRLLLLLFPADGPAGRPVWIAAALIIGVTGAAGTIAWGTTMNEWPRQP
jgi:hypothetical protein